MVGGLALEVAGDKDLDLVGIEVDTAGDGVLQVVDAHGYISTYIWVVLPSRDKNLREKVKIVILKSLSFFILWKKLFEFFYAYYLGV